MLALIIADLDARVSEFCTRLTGVDEDRIFLHRTLVQPLLKSLVRLTVSCRDLAYDTLEQSPASIMQRNRYDSSTVLVIASYYWLCSCAYGSTGGSRDVFEAPEGGLGNS